MSSCGNGLVHRATRPNGLLSLTNCIRYYLGGMAKSDGNLPPIPKLSPREAQVIALRIRGSQVKEIAHQLNISFSTAKHHLASVFRKLRVTNSIELAQVYRDQTGSQG